MVEAHAWIVARSASGTSARAAGGSERLWERRSERATRCIYLCRALSSWMLWNEARMSRTSSGIKDCVRGKWANGSTSGDCTSRRTGSTTASRPMGRKSLPLGDPLGDVGEWQRRKTRGPSVDGEGRGDGHDMRPTCRASTSSRLRRGLLGGKGLCGGLATSVAIGSAVSVFGPSCVLFGSTASQLTGLAPLVVGRPGRAGRAGGCPRFARRCRYAGCQVGTAQSAHLTPTSVVASLHYRKSLKPSANHRSRAGEERSEQSGVAAHQQ